MKLKLLILLISTPLLCLFNAPSIQAQSYFTKDNWESQLSSFSTINGQWRTSNPTNNTLGANSYQGINFGYDINNYSSLVNPIGTNDLYFGRWSFDWQGWRKIMMTNENGNVGIGTTDPKSKLHVFGQENGDFNGLVIDNRKNYGSGSGINQTSRILLSLSENSVPNPLDRIFSIIESGTLSESDSSNGRLSFYVRQWGSVNEKMRINYNGNVGIGTTTPIYKLDTGILAFDTADGGSIRFGQGERDAVGDKYPTSIKAFFTSPSPVDLGLNFYVANANTAGATEMDRKKLVATMLGNGNVGIGTTSPDEKLTVKGKIHAQEVRVDLVGYGPDYVFEKYFTGKSELKSDYVMPTLAEIENFTKKNHHLPNVPSAKEIQQNGLSLGEMSNVLLQKVEELTLYAIEQQKKLEVQNKTIEMQSKILEDLTARLNSLEKK